MPAMLSAGAFKRKRELASCSPDWVSYKRGVRKKQNQLSLYTALYLSDENLFWSVCTGSICDLMC